MKSFLILLLWGALPLWADSHAEHEAAEQHFRPTYLSLATGDLETIKRHNESNAWPVSLLSIGHTNASYQRYGFASPYFHHGLDIRADAGSDVLASKGGKVVNIENYEPGNPAYWEVAILDDDGFLWQYHHIDNQSIPQTVKNAYKAGGKIPAGTKLGEVFYWGVVSFGERYHHIHLNIIGKDKKYLSPFLFLEHLPDKSAPNIQSIFLTKSGDKFPGSTVSGKYSIAANVKDLILSDRFSVPPHEIKVTIDSDPPRTVWNFDELPGGSSTSKYVDSFYVADLVCGDYSCREPIIDLGFNLSGQNIMPTQSGPHQIKVEARDFEGNFDTKTFSWTVQ